MKAVRQFFSDLFFAPQYAGHPEYVKWCEASEKVDGELDELRSKEAVEYAWKAYEETRELHFRGEAKRDEFLKFTSGLIAFLGVALGTGRFVWSPWLAASLFFPISAAVILLLSRRSIALPGLPDITEIRVSLRLANVGEWMARNLGRAREALIVLALQRARQLDVALWLLAAGLICLAIWALTTPITSSAAGS